jgi:hypothetical protein
MMAAIPPLIEISTELPSLRRENKGDNAMPSPSSL